LESVALSLITPPNGSGGGGICFPSMVVVALGEPGSPVVCICALAEDATAMAAAMNIAHGRTYLLGLMLTPWVVSDGCELVFIEID